MSTEPKPPAPYETWRMHAYYYGFDRTGEPCIDLILSAVACAGKAFHHTDGWTDTSPIYNDAHRGETPVEWIQFAADDARAELAALRKRVKKMERALIRFSDCDLHDGNCASLEIASKRIRALARAALERKS